MNTDNNIQHNPLAADLDHILSLTDGFWEELRGKRIFITGGTGFFGRWFLESFAWANERFGLNASITVLTRNPDAFKKKALHLATHPAIKFIVGDVRDFDFPEDTFDYIIHAAATSAVATFNNEDPLIKFDTIVEGTRHVLEFAVHCGAKKILYTSSGAMYGKQPSDMTHIPEDYTGAPDSTDINSVWGESKRVAEILCVYYAKKYGVEIKIARCFSFVGPHLPLDIHYAVGNFIRDGIAGGPIRINGDGTPYRSYLYASDLMVWLWTILSKGVSCRAYNVGSENSMTIGEVAEIVANVFKDPIDVIVEKVPVAGVAPSRYVPSTQRAQSELALRQTVDFKDAVRRTIRYHENQ